MKIFILYSSSVYSCHLFLISSASVRSIPFLSFIVPIFAWNFLGGSDSKSVCLQCRRPGFDPWVGKIPWRRKWQPTPALLPGKLHGQRSLIGYSPWGRRVRHDWATSLSLLLLHEMFHCISNFLEELSILSPSIVFLYFFALITEEGFLIFPCYSLELCIQTGLSFLFSFAFYFSSFLSYL